MENKKEASLTYFSLTDFLAYLFPGAIGLAALLLIDSKKTQVFANFLMTINKNFSGPEIFVSVITGSLGVAASYVLGILFSSLTQVIHFDKFIDNYWDIKNPFNNKYLSHLEKDIPLVIEYFLDTPNTNKQVSTNEKTTINGNSGDGKQSIKFGENIFYTLRSIVRTEDQRTTALAERQSSLRQIRRNLIFPLILWFPALWQYCNVISLSLVFFFIVISSYGIILGIKRNREFEVRDYCLGAWWLYKKDILGKKERQLESNTSK